MEHEARIKNGKYSLEMQNTPPKEPNGQIQIIATLTIPNIQNRTKKHQGDVTTCYAWSWLNAATMETWVLALKIS